MGNNVRIHWSLATLIGMGLGVFAFGCSAPETGEDVDGNDDEPAVHAQVACTDTCVYFYDGGSYTPPPANLKVALKTSNGKYLTAGAGNLMMATASTVSPTETFEILWGDASYSFFYLRTSAGLFVEAENGGNGVVYVNNPTVGHFQSFSLRNLASGKTGLRSFYSYDVAAVGGGGTNVFTIANPNPSWYTFTMVDVSANPLSHPLCTTGAALNRSMGSCVAKVCAGAPQCCSTSWDASCVSAVTNVCALTC